MLRRRRTRPGDRRFITFEKWFFVLVVEVERVVHGLSLLVVTQHDGRSLVTLVQAESEFLKALLDLHH